MIRKRLSTLFHCEGEFPMQINEIIQKALRLPATARFEIVDQLMQSLYKPDPEIERLLGEEAVRRQTYAAYEVFGRD